MATRQFPELKILGSSPRPVAYFLFDSGARATSRQSISFIIPHNFLHSKLSCHLIQAIAGMNVLVYKGRSILVTFQSKVTSFAFRPCIVVIPPGIYSVP